MKRKHLLSLLFLQILVINIFRGQTFQCQRTEYWTGNQCCPMCPAASRVKTDCTEYRSTSCQPCTEGTFMIQPTGLKKCLPCANCDEGAGLKIKTPCTTKKDTVCEPKEGFFCVEPSGDDCEAAQKHRSCKPGQYISKKGTALTDTECSACSGGTYSNGTFTSCLTHTKCESKGLQLINPGTVSTDAECGEQSTSSTAVVVVVVIVAIVTVGAASVAVWYLCRKKGGCQKTVDHRNGEKSKQKKEDQDRDEELVINLNT